MRGFNINHIIRLNEKGFGCKDILAQQVEVKGKDGIGCSANNQYILPVPEVGNVPGHSNGFKYGELFVIVLIGSGNFYLSQNGEFKA